MANKKKEVYRPGPMTEGKRNIIQGLLREYDIQSAADIQEALKDLLGGTIKEMMEAEMDESVHIFCRNNGCQDFPFPAVIGCEIQAPFFTPFLDAHSA